MSKLTVNQKKCIGCGLCTSIAPKTFRMGKNGSSEVINPKGNGEQSGSKIKGDSEATIKEAISSCPVNAISSR